MIWLRWRRWWLWQCCIYDDDDGDPTVTGRELATGPVTWERKCEQNLVFKSSFPGQLSLKWCWIFCPKEICSRETYSNNIDLIFIHIHLIFKQNLYLWGISCETHLFCLDLHNNHVDFWQEETRPEKLTTNFDKTKTDTEPDPIRTTQILTSG